MRRAKRQGAGFVVPMVMRTLNPLVLPRWFVPTIPAVSLRESPWRLGGGKFRAVTMMRRRISIRHHILNKDLACGRPAPQARAQDCGSRYSRTTKMSDMLDQR